MQRVADLTQYSACVRQAKAGQRQVVSNSFLLAGDIERLIRQERLYTCDLANGTAFLADEGAFYHLTFYMLLADPGCLEGVDKPVVCELLYRAGAKTPALGAAETAWLERGFSLHKTSQQMACSPMHFGEQQAVYHADITERLRQGSFMIRAAAQDQIPAVLELWAEVLDPFDLAFTSADELTRESAAQRILGIYAADQSLCGAFRYTITGSTSVLWHLAIRKPFRRKVGMGTALVLEWLRTAAGTGIRTCSCWIDILNAPSLGLFRKLGFQPTGKMSDQLVKDGKKEGP